MRPFLFILIIGISACYSKQSDNQKNNDSLLVEQTKVQTTEKSYLIKEKSIGDVHIGEVLTKVPYFKYEIKDSTINEEGTEYQRQCAFVTEDDELLMFLWLNDLNTVDEIKIISEKFRTAQNVGVGSSLTDLLAGSGEIEIYYTYESDRFYAQTDNLTDIQFNISPHYYIGNKGQLTESDNVTIKPSEFKKDAEIESIRIY